MGVSYFAGLQQFADQEAEEERQQKSELLVVLVRELSSRLESLGRTYDILDAYGFIYEEDKTCYENITIDATAIVVQPDQLGMKPGARLHLVAIKLSALERSLSAKLCRCLR